VQNFSLLLQQWRTAYKRRLPFLFVDLACCSAPHGPVTRTDRPPGPCGKSGNTELIPFPAQRSMRASCAELDTEVMDHNRAADEKLLNQRAAEGWNSPPSVASSTISAARDSDGRTALRIRAGDARKICLTAARSLSINSQFTGTWRACRSAGLGSSLRGASPNLDHFRWDPVQYGLIFSVLQS